jgi:hypothetical protein
MNKKWKGSRYLAKCCDTVIQSQYSGHFVRCKCGKCAIDETPYYGRFIGDAPNLLELLLDKVEDIVVHSEKEE